LYQSVREQFVSIKKTADDVVAIGKDVKSFWGTLRKLFGGSPKPQAAKSVAKAKSNEYVDVNETEVKAKIIKDLSSFFKIQAQLADHIRESEERFKTVVFADDVNIMEESLNMVLAAQEMERMVVQIREIMVYGSKDMGALYSEVFAMRDVIAADQEKARKNRDAEIWQRKQKERLLAEKQTYLLVTILCLLYIWMLIGFISRIGGA
jgi:uncharacterized protein YdiU (UPF0061 family)